MFLKPRATTGHNSGTNEKYLANAFDVPQHPRVLGACHPLELAGHIATTIKDVCGDRHSFLTPHVLTVYHLFLIHGISKTFMLKAHDLRTPTRTLRPS